VVRTRLTVQQAHTREWLGTFGDAGNGERWPRLARAAERIAEYMRARGMLPTDGIVRLDGEYGFARTAVVLGKHGLGYLMRCVDYRLLDEPLVRAALAKEPQHFVQADTGTARDTYDVGWVAWRSEVDTETVTARLVVTSRAVPDGEDPKIGKREGDRVFEMFVTDRGPEALGAADVLSLYFGRGGFEQTLSEEDREIDPDRWFSGHPHGQELSQILAQWTWNTRLQMGLAMAPCEPRVTLWSAAIPADDSTRPVAAAVAAAPTPSADEQPVPSSEPVPEQAASVDAPPSLPDLAPPPAPIVRRGFSLMPDGTLRCPQDKTLRRAEVVGARVRFRARDSDCRACSRVTECLRGGASGRRGRRVMWPASELAPRLAAQALPPSAPPAPSTPPSFTPPTPPSFTPPARPGPEPLLWHDLPATSLRRLLSSTVRQQRIEGWEATRPAPPPHLLLDRDRRAHRRISWHDRLTRNARPPAAPALRLHLHGIPAKLAAYLGLRTEP
jgi:hypothetical protein